MQADPVLQCALACCSVLQCDSVKLQVKPRKQILADGFTTDTPSYDWAGTHFQKSALQLFYIVGFEFWEYLRVGEYLRVNGQKMSPETWLFNITEKSEILKSQL